MCIVVFFVNNKYKCRIRNHSLKRLVGTLIFYENKIISTKQNILLKKNRTSMSAKKILKEWHKKGK